MLVTHFAPLLIFFTVLFHVTEQKFKVCKRPPPVLSKRRQLSRSEIRRLEAVTDRLKKDWFGTSRRCTADRCIRDKRDTEAVKPVSDRTAHRQTRSVNPKRKDYRQLKKKEMRKLHEALQLLKGSSEYDNLVEFHNSNEAQAAHFGAAFMPWHREYLYRLEQAIRDLGNRYRKVTIPYWDSCLEEILPDPRDCVVWTKEFWGPPRGVVENGKVAPNWQVTPVCAGIGATLTRASTGDKSLLLTRDKLANDLLPSATFTELALFAPTESYHGDLHGFVGGHINDLQCSPNDPVFHFLHAMVDCIWEEWSKLPGKINTYPVPSVHGANLANMGGPLHLANAVMQPFDPLENINGFDQNKYTGCKKRPSLIQCKNDKDCQSSQRMIFCHECQCHCKVRTGGDCTGLPDNACYCKKKSKTPECQNNKCKCT